MKMQVLTLKYLQRWLEIVGTTTKNGVVPVATSN